MTLNALIPRLFATPPLRLPFGRALDARAFLLQRDHGNVLLYGAAAMAPHADEAAALGGIARQYLNHAHEATPEADAIARRFGAPLLVHAGDAEEAGRTATVHHTFTRRHHLDGDLEVIPVPGHTPGATAFAWDTGEHHVLFTGDTLYLRDGEWRAALLDGISDRDAYVASLELIGELDFDLLAPGIATDGDAWHAATGRDDARRRIGAIIERLRAGDDH